MSDLVHGSSPEALELLEALGLKVDDHITSIQIDVNYKGFVSVNVGLLITTEKMKRVSEVVRRYKLVSRGNE